MKQCGRGETVNSIIVMMIILGDIYQQESLYIYTSFRAHYSSEKLISALRKFLHLRYHDLTVNELWSSERSGCTYLSALLIYVASVWTRPSKNLTSSEKKVLLLRHHDLSINEHWSFERSGCIYLSVFLTSVASAWTRPLTTRSWYLRSKTFFKAYQLLWWPSPS